MGSDIGTSGAKQADDCRSEFERINGIVLEDRMDDSYRDAGVADSWRTWRGAWQAAVSARKPERVSSEVADARKILAKGDFLGVEESERRLREALTDQPVGKPETRSYLSRDEMFNALTIEFDSVPIGTLQDIFAFCRSQSADEQESDWQPIETAPKDEFIIVKGRDYALGEDSYARVLDESPEYIRGCFYLKDPDDDGFDWCDGSGGVYRPTQWMRG